MKKYIRWVTLSLVLGSTWAMSADDMNARITAIEDRLAIEKIVQGDYPRALDEMRMKDYAALWAEDGVLIIPSLATLRGPAVIEKFLSTPGIFDEEASPADPPREPSPPPRPYQVPHMIGSLSYVIHGDTATGSAYWTEVTLVDGVPQVVGAGRYLDELKKINGEWKFTKRTVVRDVPVMSPEVAAHVPEITY